MGDSAASDRKRGVAIQSSPVIHTSVFLFTVRSQFMARNVALWVNTVVGIIGIILLLLLAAR